MTTTLRDGSEVADPRLDRAEERSRRDALIFVAKLPKSVPEPRISVSESGEVVLEWSMDGRKAVASFEGDQVFGYAMLKGGRFMPGEHEGLLGNEDLPPDLIAYLEGRDDD